MGMPKKANIFESFSHSAIQQFKEAFGIMDTDKDGLLSASDLVAAFGAHGKSIGSGDAQAMLDEVDGPITSPRWSPCSPPRWLVVLMMTMSSLPPSKLLNRMAQLMPFGNKFSASEVDDAFAEFKIDDGQIDAAHLKGYGLKVDNLQNKGDFGGGLKNY